MILKLKRILRLKIKSKIKKFKPTIVAAPLKVWIFSILAFFGEVILFSKYAESHDGFYASYQSTIFLITILVGVIAFLILAFTVVLKFSRKLWLKSKMLFLFIIVLMIVSPVGAYYLADAKLFNNPNSQQMVQGIQQSIPTFTGQDVFDAVNSYRKSKGVGELTLDKTLCNNLAQRYLDIQSGIKEGIAHKGFDEWYEEYVKPYGNYYVEEDFASGNTPEEIIKAWEGSPGHRLSILDKSLNFGCSYASQGSAVIVLGNKQGGSSSVNSQQTSNYQNSQQPKYDGTRTGKIIPYKEWCTGKDISIYENELLEEKGRDGKTYFMTKGDWDCYNKTPTQTTQVQPTSSQKVLINVDDDGGLTKGQFYCYSDKVNLIADLQNQIRIYQAIADSCMFFEQTKAKSCSDQCPTDSGTTVDDIANCVNNCYANVVPNCNEKSTKVGDLRRQLYSTVKQNCP